MDAVQLFVRGFHDQETSNRIRAFIEGTVGFEVKVAIDGQSDSLGGIIETYITPVIELEIVDLEQIKKGIYQAANKPTVFVQWSKYEKTEDSEV